MAADQEDKNSAIPETGETDSHLKDLPGGWKMWRTIGLRGTGFPISLLDSLAAPGSVKAIDCFLDAENDAEQAKNEALEYCRHLTFSSAGENRKSWRRVKRGLRKGRAPNPLPVEPRLAALVDTLTQAMAKKDAMFKLTGKAFAKSRDLTSEELENICRMPRYREAIIWQNRKVLHESIDVLVRMAKDAPDGYRRKHERLAASYLQRYCAKNDSISFFGPIGWATWSENSRAILARPGPSLLAARHTYFEYWTIDALSEILGQNQVVLPWLSPYLDHTLRLKDGALHAPGKPPLRLDQKSAALLAAIDGQTPARDIAIRLAGDAESGFQSPKEVLQNLAALVRKHAVLWDASVPVSPFAVKALNRLIGKFGDDKSRNQAATVLRSLVRDFAAVAGAAGNPEKLDSAFAKLESRFSRVSGRKPHRYGGTTYASRTMVYEDCRRDMELSLGTPLLRHLEPPLGVVLQSANWFAGTIGEKATRYFDAVFDTLAQDTGNGVVEFHRLFHFHPTASRDIDAIIDETAAELHRRWISVIPVDGRLGEVRVDVADIRERALQEFPDMPTPWPAARSQSPDIMIAAESIDDIENGRFLFVLGETHTGSNTLLQPCFALQHPDPEGIVRDGVRDIGRPQIMTTTRRERLGTRVTRETLSPGDYHLAIYPSRSWKPPEKILRIGDLSAERTGGGILVRDRARGLSFHLQEFFRLFFGPRVAKRFSLFSTDSHLPRVTLDKMVISRETWRATFADMKFSQQTGLASIFLAARRWRRTLNFPRWVFVRVPFEMKPVYVDFDSPVSVDLLAKLIRRGRKEIPQGSFTISEMLPNPLQCWLPDAEGNRYSSELRMVVVAADRWAPKKG